MPSVLLIGPSSSGSPLAVLAEALRDAGNTVATAHMPTSQDDAFALCRGVNTVVIVPEVQDVGGRTWLDTAGRGTYDLLSAACDSTTARSVVVLSTLDLFLAYPAAFKIDSTWKPRPSTDPAQLSPHVTEFVAREFARGSALSVVVARLGHLDDSTARFWVQSSDAAAQLVNLVAGPAAQDPMDTHHHPGKYRIVHLIDPSCDVLPAGEDIDVAAARAAVAATPDPVPEDSISNVLLLGANGMLGPPVVNELGDTYALSVTDLNPYGWRKGGDAVVAGTGERDDIDLVKPLSDFAQPCEAAILDVADAAGVAEATAGVDATVNCAVLRPHPKLAFDVNTTGTYNAIKSAVENGHSRFINTGPHFTVVGYTYEDYDFDISTEIPPHPGLNLYSLSKGIGQEICKVFADNHPIHVILCLFLSFPPADEPSTVGQGTNPFSVTFADAAVCIRKMLEVDLATLPSKCETFFCTSDLPHGRYGNQKTKDLLGWQPKDLFTKYYLKPKL